MKNNISSKRHEGTGLSGFVKTWHLVMVVLYLTAFLTGDLADDYKKIEHAGFSSHGLLGMAAAFVLCLYLCYSMLGPSNARLSHWFPFTGERLRETWDDLTTLFRFELPEHRRRRGLTGLVQFLGILIFFWLAATGVLLYFFIEPGHKTHGVLHGVKEMHEVGEILIPAYLVLHIGAVIAHSLKGNHVWRAIFFFDK